MKRFIAVFAGIVGLVALSPKLGVCGTLVDVRTPTTITVSSVTAAAGIATVTISSPSLTSPTYGTGPLTYIAHVRIEMYATATLTGGATPVTCTSTNLNSRVWKFPTAAATGTTTVFDEDYSYAVQAPNSAISTVISCPSTASVIWNVSVSYYYGS